MVVFRMSFMPLFRCGASQYLPPERQNPTTELHSLTPPRLSDNAVPIFVPRQRILAYRESTLPHVGDRKGGGAFDSFDTVGGAR